MSSLRGFVCERTLNNRLFELAGRPLADTTQHGEAFMGCRQMGSATDGSDDDVRQRD